jgi:hypothetical protein
MIIFQILFYFIFQYSSSNIPCNNSYTSPNKYLIIFFLTLKVYLTNQTLSRWVKIYWNANLLFII